VKIVNIKTMEEYLDLIYKYYPKDIHTSDLKYPYTPENVLQWKLIEDVLKNEKENNYFEDMSETLAKSLNCIAHEDFSFRGGISDLSRTCMLYLPNNPYHEEYPCCVINVSIIVKYYSIYFTKFTGAPINTLKRGNLSPVQKSLVDNKISRIIKTYYNGYQPFPMKYFNEPVLHVYSAKNYDEYATYFECLITDSLY
jgi:hypothetical protein